jgi:hypothetical protein
VQADTYEGQITQIQEKALVKQPLATRDISKLVAKLQ